MAKLIKKIYEHGNCTLDVTNLRKRKFPIFNRDGFTIVVITFKNGHFSLNHKNHYITSDIEYEYNPSPKEIINALEIAREFSHDNQVPFDLINLYGEDGGDFILVDDGYLITKDEYALIIESGLKSTILTQSSFRYRSTANFRDHISGIKNYYSIVTVLDKERDRPMKVNIYVNQHDDYNNSTISSDGENIYLNFNLSKNVIESNKGIMLPKFDLKVTKEKTDYSLTLHIDPNGSYRMASLDHNCFIDLSSLPKEISDINIKGQTYNSCNHDSLLRTLLTIPDDIKIHDGNNLMLSIMEVQFSDINIMERIQKIFDHHVSSYPVATGKFIRRFYQEIQTITKEDFLIKY